ncbi:hypothetical protein F7725_001994 [Dissostichus mawsoni]|uniref:Transmembrane protein FAM155A n=1 Tax=Dissostichus mawsoni TaxID=36200 RepID=A0A7J5Y164_DISMA|nr:hypothetical protein F7725_001994 [Dissostichus mawsoni]
MRRQHDEGLKYWFAPRENEKPFTESERAQRWRLSLASLLFITVLLSDHLWFCAEAKLTRTRDKRSEEGLAITDMGDPDDLNCSLDMGQDVLGCSKCVRAYQLLDQQAEENYREFELLVEKYETDAYSVRTCMEECKFLFNLFTLTLRPHYEAKDADYSHHYSVAPSNHLIAEEPFLERDIGTKYEIPTVPWSDSVSGLNLAKFTVKASLANQTMRWVLGHCAAVTPSMGKMTQNWRGRSSDSKSKWFISLAVFSVLPDHQMHCSKPIPCGQYCLEVQQRCPFVLPDNDDLIHGGSPSFICTGLLEDYPSGVDPNAKCCDVRWDLKVDNRSRGTLKRTHPPCQHRTSLSSSAACRLCNSRLKLCLLVLVLLHTVASLTASHNATGLGLPTITPLEESPANEE